MQFSKHAWGVTCLPGFHQALLWVPEENFLVCVIGRPLVPCLGSAYKAWKESCAHDPVWCQAAENSKPTALHSELGAYRLKANTDDGWAHRPSILDILFSSALLAELLAGVFSCLTDNRSWGAKPFYLGWYLTIHFEEVLVALSGHLTGNECSCSAEAMQSTSYSLSQCLLSDSHWAIFHKSQTVFNASLPSWCYGKIIFIFFFFRGC